VRRVTWLPSALILYISQLPSRSDIKAIHWPLPKGVGSTCSAGTGGGFPLHAEASSMTISVIDATDLLISLLCACSLVLDPIITLVGTNRNRVADIYAKAKELGIPPTRPSCFPAGITRSMKMSGKEASHFTLSPTLEASGRGTRAPGQR